jgi:diguanylate cyclase (GGDEF)-like protein
VYRSPFSFVSAPVTPEQRYAALADVSRLLETAMDPESCFPALHARIHDVLRDSAFLAALCDGDHPPRALYRHGRAEGCQAFAEGVIEQLEMGWEAVGGVADRSFIAAPLRREGRLVGCLAAEREADGRYGEEDAAFLKVVGRIAAAAIDNARIAALARRRGEDIERLEAAARDLSASLEPTEVVQRVAEHARALVEKPVVVWLVDENSARAAARAGGALVRIGEERNLSADDRARIGSAGQALREALDRDDLDAWLAVPGHALAEPQPAVAGLAPGGRIVVPLMLGQRLVAFLAVGPWTDDRSNRERVRLLLRLAPYAASAIENARMHAELREASLTDPLVQLPNRRQLDLFLEREFAAAQRGRPLSFVLFDLDHFKVYNDTFGHREGDSALIRFANVLRAETRSMNLAARYGGEEFAAVLSGATLSGGHSYAERVRQRVLREMSGRLSVSAGVAEFRPGMSSPEDLVVAADRALYRAKMEGRNRICVADG